MHLGRLLFNGFAAKVYNQNQQCYQRQIIRQCMTTSGVKRLEEAYIRTRNKCKCKNS